MKVQRAGDYEDMSRKAANILFAQVTLKPDCVLGLATGSTPLGVYRRLIDWYQKGELDFSGITSINLDEYAGLPPDHPQSYRYFMQDNLFNHINIDPRNTYVPDGLATDEAAECASYDLLIEQYGIDLQLLGLGNNGHIAFNEPGGAFTAGTHRTALTESTIEANKRFFASASEVPRFAYTMGIGSIMGAKKIVIIASGRGKARAVRETVKGPVTPQVPASILQLHRDVTLVADEEALSEL